MSAATVEAAVKRALQARGAKSDQLTPEFDFVKAGIVDSLSLLRFVLALEDTFRIRLSDAEIVSPRFRTFAGVCSIIQAKLEQAS